MAKKKKSQVEQVLDHLPKVSKITAEQRTKILKAGVYAFVSSFTAMLSLQLNSGVELSQTLFLSAFISGVNASIVAVKQLFTK